MTLFQKLFTTYLTVVLLALVISGSFAGYLVREAAGKTEVRRLQAFGRDLAGRLRDREFTPDHLGRIEGIMNALDHTQSAGVWIVDRDGRVVMASNSAPVARGELMRAETMQAVVTDQTWFQRSKPVPGFGAPTVAVSVLRGGEVRGVIFLTAFRGVFQKAILDILEFTLYGSAVAAGILAVISYYLSRRIAGPVAAVDAAARRLAQGDFSSRVEWRSDDEVGRLAASFNAMASELERLERARKELLANVSHELKGPLARISGYLEAIHDGIGGPEARDRHFTIVRREVSRLGRLVNDLLEFSRLQAGRLMLHTSACDLAPNLKRVAEVFEAPAQAAGVSLIVQIPPLLPIVECDPGRIEQALTNLVENSITFTPAGGTVIVSAREEADALHVEVADTGPGIPPDELDRVWERFYKIDQARTPGCSQGGSGLGLAIVKQLIERQGGQVFARSQPEAGSTFGFRLRLRKKDGAGAG